MKKALKLFVNFDKEESWLNHMAAEGNLVASVGPLYSFAPVSPGSVTVRIDYRANMSATDYDDYRSLFLDAGWKHIAGSRSGGAQYFASSSSDASADIFSDAASKARRYRRAIGLNAALILPFVVILMTLWPLDEINFDSPSEWYLTPGIWEMRGWEFTRAFLLETPFVVLRAGGPLLIAVGCLVMFALIAYRGILYRRALTSSTV